MKIPGLEDITANMDKFAEMLPVLESINNNLRLLVEIQSEHLPPDYRREYRKRVS